VFFHKHKPYKYELFVEAIVFNATNFWSMLNYFYDYVMSFLSISKLFVLVISFTKGRKIVNYGIFYIIYAYQIEPQKLLKFVSYI